MIPNHENDKYERMEDRKNTGNGVRLNVLFSTR